MIVPDPDEAAPTPNPAGTSKEKWAVQRRKPQRPSYWRGAGLNALLSGAGLMSLGQMPAGFAWAVAFFVLSLYTSAEVGWAVGFVGSLLHYNSVYDRMYP
ncbi:hypothetical protein [Deinococcus hopiensis]|uniref:Uncharacterized protein n=1 Tax=Deinococcus hopiensis KR-140 TaxID=695939 RepID=A0A1W1VUL6_9DEIO|nr:hypothetical protein [Deinococcus hopiensis]SMB97067.1 hypothetical protein SAMN00790413_06324 [Deinococcus hopiensis KR-140]